MTEIFLERLITEFLIQILHVYNLRRRRAIKLQRTNISSNQTKDRKQRDLGQGKLGEIVRGIIGRSHYREQKIGGANLLLY